MKYQLASFFTLSLSIASVHAYGLPNTDAVFGDSPQPFRINVDPGFLEETQLKVNHARLPDNVDAFPFSDGPATVNFTAVRNAWLQNYNWDDVQTQINNQLQQFTITVTPANSTYNESVPLHFVHHVSPRSDAIPMLWVHGWPGSFLEVTKIIDQLTNPPNSSLPAFHVVAPSIPGFGFSPAPIKPGFGPSEAGDAFNALMHQLGYPQYVGQGGDFGHVILRAQAIAHPDSLVSLLSNFWVIYPNATDLTKFDANQTTPEETGYINLLFGFIDNFFGYGFLQSANPLTPAYATTDSPMGLAMWIFSVMRVATEPGVFAFTPEEVITWTMMYWIQGPYGGMRFYKEVRAEGFITPYTLGSGPGYVTIPTAIAEFPYDVWYGLPLDWAQRAGNVKQRYVHDKGGHFAAYEVPEVLLGDIWDWFGNNEVSGTSVFFSKER